MRANPAGNITLFVLSPVEKKDHASLAEKLMALEQFKAEQVGYCCEQLKSNNNVPNFLLC